MASMKPTIRTYLDIDTYAKFKFIAEENKKSMSRELEQMILKKIWEYEQEHGEIQLEINTPIEMVKDIKKQIKKEIPYGDK